MTSTGTLVELTHFIGGTGIAPANPSDWITNCDPSTGVPLLRLPRGGPEDASRAVGAAEAAQPEWAALPFRDRAALLLDAAARLDAASEHLALVDVRETGKPLALARALAAGAAVHVREFVAAGDQFADQLLADGHRQLYDPHGVVAVVVPWNAAVEVVMRTLPAVLLMGSTAVLKPSERAPWAVRELVDVLALPDGVVNVLLGDASSGAPLVDDPRVDFVIHTGSVESGRAIARASASLLRPVLLELGGKDPVIVDHDVDIEWAAGVVATGAWINTGQLCTAMERVYVDASVAEPFVSALVARAEQEVVGAGADPATTVGPLIDARMRDLVADHVTSAVASGARALTGGLPLERDGWFYPPTVLVDVADDMAVMHSETFGPVAPVRVVPDIETAVALANASRYGLAATVLTARPEGVAAARRLRAGTVWVNNYLAGTPGARSVPRGESGLGVVGDRRAVLEAVSVPRVLHLAGDAATWDTVIEQGAGATGLQERGQQS